MAIDGKGSSATPKLASKMNDGEAAADSVSVQMSMPEPELGGINANGEFGLCKRTKQVHLLSLQKFRLYNFFLQVTYE